MIGSSLFREGAIKNSPLNTSGVRQRSHGSTLLAPQCEAALLRSNGRTRLSLLKVQESCSEVVQTQIDLRGSHRPPPSLRDLYFWAVLRHRRFIGVILTHFCVFVKWFLVIVIMLTKMLLCLQGVTIYGGSGSANHKKNEVTGFT